MFCLVTCSLLEVEKLRYNLWLQVRKFWHNWLVEVNFFQPTSGYNFGAIFFLFREKYLKLFIVQYYKCARLFIIIRMKISPLYLINNLKYNKNMYTSIHAMLCIRLLMYTHKQRSLHATLFINVFIFYMFCIWPHHAMNKLY